MSEWLDDRVSDWLNETERDQQWMVLRRGVCCHFLTQGCETCQHQKPKHVYSVSQRFCKDRTLLTVFYTSTRPSLGLEMYDCSLPCDKSQVCSCGLSHTVLSHSVTTHLLLWPVAKNDMFQTERYITGWHESEWFKGLRRVFMYLSCLIKSTISILGNIFLSEIWPWRGEVYNVWTGWPFGCIKCLTRRQTSLHCLWSCLVVTLQHETLEWIVWCNRVQVVENIYITK